MGLVEVPRPPTLEQRMTACAERLAQPELKSVWLDIAEARELLLLGVGAIARNNQPITSALANLEAMRRALEAQLGDDTCRLCGTERECPCCVTNSERCNHYDD